MISLTLNKLGYGSEPTPESVKKKVLEVEKLIKVHIGELSPYIFNKKEYVDSLNQIHDDIKSIRPILDFLSAKDRRGKVRAFNENNISDTYQYYDEFKSIVFGDMEPNENADINLNSKANLVGLFKNAFENTKGLADKIEVLTYLGNLSDLDSLKAKIEKTIKLGDMLVSAINGEGRSTVSAVEELQQECKATLTDIHSVEASMEALSVLPDRFEKIVSLLRDSLLERIRDIRGG